MSNDNYGDLHRILNSQDALLGDDQPPLILATNWELLDVLEGKELTFSTDDGGRVRIRLYNPDELIAAQKAAAGAPGHDPGGLTRQKAIELCMPLSMIMRHGVRRPS